LDYFNDVFITFLGRQVSITIEQVRRETALRFNQKYLNLCSERKSYRFEQHEGE